MTLFIGTFKKEADYHMAEDWALAVNDNDSYCLVSLQDDDYHDLLAASLQYGDPIIAIGNRASDALYDLPHFKLPIALNREKLKECRTFIQNTKVRQNESDK